MNTAVRPNMSAVILNYNGRELLEKYLPSVVLACEAYSSDRMELIVVDDASTDDSAEYLESGFPSFKLIINEVNEGFGRSANIGIGRARNQIVILLNNDIELEKDFFCFIPAHFQDKDVFSVRPGIKINRHDRPEDLKNPRIGGGFKYGFFDIPMEMRKKTDLAFFSGGGGSAFDREKFLNLGGFDDIYRPFYYEDSDLSYRAWKRGWKVVYEPRSMLYHQGGATIFKAHSRFLVETIAERNRYVLVWKNITDPWLVFNHLFFIMPRLVVMLLKGRIASALGFFYAVTRIGKVMKRRASEKRFAKVKDREIFNYFKE